MDDSNILRTVWAGALIIAAVIWPVLTLADDWPQWRGPMRDGVWRETGILKEIPASGLKIRWRARIGQGYSGPAVAKGRVYVTDRTPNPDFERVLCLEEATGKLLWEHSYPCEYGDLEYGNGPRATPTVHDGKVYTLGTKGHLICLDAAKGDVIWSKDLVQEYDARMPRWGISAAPVVEGDLLIVSAGGQPEASIIAFDRNTGEEQWKTLPDPPSYSAPIVITAGGKRQVIAWTAENVVALDPATGGIFWKEPFKTNFGDAQVVASPVLRDDLLLCLAAWSRGSLMLRLDSEKPAASVLWRTRKEPTTMFSTPIFPGKNHFYATINNGSLACLEAATGDEVWTTREPTGEAPGGHAHLTPNGDRVFLFNHRGQLILAKLSPAGYEEAGRCLLVEPTNGYRPQRPITWAHPAYANRSVFARNDRELVCASLSTADAAAEITAAPQTEARIIKGFTGRSSALGLAISPDGKRLAVGTFGGMARLVEWSGANDLPAPKKHRYAVCSVDFSPDGRLLVSAGGNAFQKNAEIVLWDTAAGTERARVSGHTDKINAVAFSPDGKTIATGSSDQTVKLWNAADLEERAVLKGHTEAVSSLAFSPDGGLLVSAGWDGTVRFWDPATGEERGKFTGHEEGILAVAFSPDGKTIATGSTDWTVRLWDPETKTERAVLGGHRGAVYSAAFSPDGKTLATGSGDETVKLWNVELATERKTLRGHKSGITALSFTPNGQSLVSAGRDDDLRIWKLGGEQE